MTLGGTENALNPLILSINENLSSCCSCLEVLCGVLTKITHGEFGGLFERTGTLLGEAGHLGMIGATVAYTLKMHCRRERGLIPLLLGF